MAKQALYPLLGFVNCIKSKDLASEWILGVEGESKIQPLLVTLIKCLPFSELKLLVWKMRYYTNLTSNGLSASKSYEGHTDSASCFVDRVHLSLAAKTDSQRW